MNKIILKLLKVCVLISSVSVVATNSIAADPKSEKKTGKKVVYRKTQEVSFDGSDVDGVARSPDGAFVYQRKTAKFFPLFKVKQNFDQEIKNSVDYLK